MLSGDKKGQVAIWDHAKVYDRTVYNLNRALTNKLRFLPGSDGMQCCSASSDGTLKVLLHFSMQLMLKTLLTEMHMPFLRC